MSLILDNITILKHDSRLLTVNVEVKKGEIVAVMGPSGAGKSTLLDGISGQLTPPFTMEGQLILNGQVMNDIPAHQRNIGILYQDALLFEHLNVGENIAFAMQGNRQGRNKQERRDAIAEYLTEVGLGDLQDRSVHTLSGGQQARVALLRTLAAKPDAVLLDEAFGKLDATRKTQFRDWVFTQLVKRQLPTLMVTHDIADAEAAGGRIIEV
jgi:putative thiamine transport system ATP-binding protein